jgi:hypothetical protein
MKRTPLQRRTPLRRSAPLNNRAPLERRTPLRKGKRSRGVPKAITSEVVLRDGGCVAPSMIPAVKCWGRLDPHHVLRRSQGGPDTPENLVTLCRAHHDWVHTNPKHARELGLLKQPTHNPEEQP